MTRIFYLKAAVDIFNNKFLTGQASIKSFNISIFKKNNFFRPIYTTDGPLPTTSLGVLLISEIVCIEPGAQEGII